MTPLEIAMALNDHGCVSIPSRDWNSDARAVVRGVVGTGGYTSLRQGSRRLIVSHAWLADHAWVVGQYRCSVCEKLDTDHPFMACESGEWQAEEAEG